METNYNVGTVTSGSDGRPRILVVDHHPLVREGLADLINGQHDLLCGGGAGNMLEAQRAVAEQSPDLVLLDLRLGNEDGLELIKILKAQARELRILVLSQLDETVYAERALRAGAMGYVMKEQATDEVLSAIRRVLAGEICVSQEVAAMAVQRLLEDGPAMGGAQLSWLSDRELRVFNAIGAGQSVSAIAAELNLSVKTVQTYCKRIKYKFGLASGAELVGLARRTTEAGAMPVMFMTPTAPLAPPRPCVVQ
jgi:DNA-binding NarL/FixJ family response regulator